MLSVGEVWVGCMLSVCEVSVENKLWFGEVLVGNRVSVMGDVGWEHVGTIIMLVRTKCRIEA